MRSKGTLRRNAAAGALAAITLAAAGVSACSSSNGSTLSMSPSTSSSTSTSSTGTGTDRNGGVVTPSTGNICTLVSADEVTMIAVDKVVQVTPAQTNSPADPASYQCTYHLDSGSEVKVMVEVTGSPAAFAVNLRFVTGGALASVPGIGRQAMASVNGIAVLTDKYNFEITGLPAVGSPPYSGEKTLARMILKVLG